VGGFINSAASGLGPSEKANIAAHGITLLRFMESLLPGTGSAGTS
jgi:hypothetical protein